MSSFRRTLVFVVSAMVTLLFVSYATMMLGAAGLPTAQNLEALAAHTAALSTTYSLAFCMGKTLGPSFYIRALGVDD